MTSLPFSRDLAGTQAPSPTRPAPAPYRRPTPSPADRLRARIETVSAGVVLTLEGDIDLSTEQRLRDAMASALARWDDLAAAGGDGAAAARPSSLVVDLRGIRFLDSTGMGALLVGRKTADARGARFAVAVLPGGRIARILRLTRLHKLIEVLSVAADAELPVAGNAAPDGTTGAA